MEVTPCTGSLTMSGRSSFGSSDRIALTCNYPYTGRAMDLFPGTSYPMIYSPEHHTPVDLFPVTNDIHSVNSRHPVVKRRKHHLPVIMLMVEDIPQEPVQFAECGESAFSKLLLYFREDIG